MSGEKKAKYKPFTSVEVAYTFLQNQYPEVAVEGIMGQAEIMIYAEILRLHERLDQIENQATEMMSPDKMMEMATKFLGGGF